MKNVLLPSLSLATFSALLCVSAVRGQVADVPNARPVAGIPVNDVEANVKPYVLPELLKLSNGQPVTDAKTWMTQRRPEIVKFYETQVYGRIPATAPKVTWEVASVDKAALDGIAVMKQIVGHMGGPDGPAIHVTLYTPAKANKPVPVIVAFQFPPMAPRAQTGAAGANANAKAGAPAARPPTATSPATGSREAAGAPSRRTGSTQPPSLLS